MDLISWIDLNETIFVYLALSSLRIFSILSFCFFSLSHDGRAINISTEYSIAIMVFFWKIAYEFFLPKYEVKQINGEKNKRKFSENKNKKKIELKWDKIFIWHFMDSLSMNLCISSLKVSVTFNECNFSHFFECIIRILLWACKTKIPLIKTEEWLSWFELIILLTNHNFGHFNTI